jgi:hypothetical protein
MTARKRMAYFVGADPGKSGGLALLDHRGTVVTTTPMPEVDADLLAWLTIARREAKAAGHPCRAWVEAVHSSPQMGVVSAFTFGQQDGRLKMALRAAGVAYTLVTAWTWQRGLGIVPHAGDKRVMKILAQRWFPKEKITHAIADALLIAEYGRLQAGGRPPKERHGEEAPVRREETHGPEDDERQRDYPPDAAPPGATAGDRAGAEPEAGRGVPRPGGSAVE